nr:MAG: ORF1 [Torque teno midi virus]
MPFFNYRRSYYQRWRKPRTWRRYYRRKKRTYRRLRTRRPRKTVRRSRYGRRKPTTRVRRKKKQFLKLVQWQPEFIKRCKIIGNENVISFGQGRQSFNFTQHVRDIVPNNFSWGGGFFISVYTLGYLYEMLSLYRNVWTSSNDGYDLARYTGCEVTFYRHPTCDYVVIYTRSPPMTINRLSYPSCHPSRLIMQRKKIYIPSLQTKPFGKRYVKRKIRPPKLITSRWFFQEELSKVNLVMFMGSAISPLSPYLSNNTDNNCAGISILNTDIFPDVGFLATTYTTKKTIYAYKDKKMIKLKDFTYSSTGYFWPPYLTGQTQTYWSKESKTEDTIPMETIDTTKWERISLTHQLRYQPNRDTGKNTTIWLESLISKNLDIPSSDSYKLEDLPLWLIGFGFIDYMDKLHPRDDLYRNFCIVLKSPFPKGFNYDYQPGTPFIPLSQDFMRGKGEYGSPVELIHGQYWIPCVNTQLSAINDICNCGPYIAKPTGKGFDLNMKYKFYFKWGGNILTQKQIVDPSKQRTYPIPRDLISTVQVKDPEGKEIKTQFHKWDYRRGFLTAQALKRAMQDTDITDSSSTDGEEHQVKRRRTGEPAICHQEGSTSVQVPQSSEEDSCQEETQETELQLFQLQQQQQLQHQLIKSIQKLKKKQRYISLLAGHIE